MRKTLHNAIMDLISLHGSMNAKDIAKILNETKSYEKKDGSEIQASQIYARVARYPELFCVEEGKICRRNNGTEIRSCVH